MTPITKGDLGIYSGGPIIRPGSAPRIYIDEGTDDRTAVALVQHLKDGGVEVLHVRTEDPKPSGFDLAEAAQRRLECLADDERRAWNAQVAAKRRAKKARR